MGGRRGEQRRAKSMTLPAFGQSSSEGEGGSRKKVPRFVQDFSAMKAEVVSLFEDFALE